jgi:hypothetical protein
MMSYEFATPRHSAFLHRIYHEFSILELMDSCATASSTIYVFFLAAGWLKIKKVSPSDCAVPIQPLTTNPEMNARSLCRSSKTRPLHTKRLTRCMMLSVNSHASGVLLKLSPRRLGLSCLTLHINNSTPQHQSLNFSTQSTVA